jgi:hypothetical protein
MLKSRHARASEKARSRGDDSTLCTTSNIAAAAGAVRKIFSKDSHDVFTTWNLGAGS